MIRVIEDIMSNGSIISSTYYDLTSDTDKYIKITLDEMDNLISYHLLDKNALPSNIANALV